MRVNEKNHYIKIKRTLIGVAADLYCDLNVPTMAFIDSSNRLVASSLGYSIR